MNKLLQAFFLFCFLYACESTNSNFQHTIKEKQKPWTHEEINDNEGKFTFAIFSDLTGGERERIFDVAIAQLNLLQPDFIMNVGDLIEGGVSSEAEWHQQWDIFDHRVNQSIAPVFYTGGNHDLTGATAQKVWDERLGRKYYHFLYKNVLFMVLNTDDFTLEKMTAIEEARNKSLEVLKNEGWEAAMETEYAKLPERSFGEIGTEQVAYFLDVIAQNSHIRWAFIFMHKPVWLKENEDNFLQIEKALDQIPYTVFNGHTHTFNYEKRNERDYINLATTGGYQNPKKGRAMDHLTLVTMNGAQAHIAHLMMDGIADKTGHIPLSGDTLVFETKP